MKLTRLVYSPSNKKYFFDKTVNLISVSLITDNYKGSSGVTFILHTDFIDYVITPHPLHDNPPKWFFEEKEYEIKTPKDVIDFYNALNWSLIEKNLK